MPLREHLTEFRNRLILAFAGIGVAAIAGWFVYPRVFAMLQEPVLEAAAAKGMQANINFAGLATALDIQLKMSIVIGIIVSSPWWLYQLWAFVSPGLQRKEKRYTVGFLGAAIPLFLLGVALSLWVYPHAVEVLISFTPTGASNLLNAQDFMSFAMRLVLAFGLAFVFPVVMVALTAAGLVKTKTWVHGWRWAVFLIFLFCAIMTPTPDAVTMILMALPMVGLYFMAIGVGLLFERARRKRKAAAEAAEA